MPRRPYLRSVLVTILLLSTSTMAQARPPDRGAVAAPTAAVQADPVWWAVDTIDTANDFGAYAAVAIDPRDGIPFVSYYDATTGDLRLASPVAPGGGNCGPDDAWWCRTVDGTDDVGRHSSLATWQDTGLWKLGISYYNATHDVLKYAEYTETVSSGGWTFATIDNGGLYSSLEFDAAGTPHIAYYYDDPVGDDALMYTHYVGASGNCGDGAWNCDQIESGDRVGQHASLDLDGTDQPRIAYYRVGSGDLRYALYGSGVGDLCGPAGSWHCQTIDPVTDAVETPGPGPHVSLYLGTGSSARIAYYDALSDTLNYASFPVFGTGTCGPDNSWSCVTIDEVGSSTGPMGLSLAQDGAGRAVIAYHDVDDGGVLKVAQPISRLGLLAGNCGPLSSPPLVRHLWQCDTVDDGVRGPDAHTVGQYAALAIDADDLAGVAYYDATAGDLLVTSEVTEALVFTGTVSYTPATGDSRAQADVPVTLYGVPSGVHTMQTNVALVLLDSTTSAADGSFELVYPSHLGFDSFLVAKEDPRGFVPRTATVPPIGSALDPGTISFAGTTSGVVGGIGFTVGDPLLDPPAYHDRYLIVTSDSVVYYLRDFIAYKEFLGFDVIVKTVEELDPGGIGGNYLRGQIRDYERSLLNGDGGLTYVLLIGGHETVPYMTYNPGGLDLSRDPNAWQWQQPNGPCRNFAVVPNNCGWAGDWYYVDLTSNWDSNGDGILGEAFWADPAYIQDQISRGVLPANYVPDTSPAFRPDVFVGRLPIDHAIDAWYMTRAIMDFERDGGDWKHNTLLAGAMLTIEGDEWDPPNNTITGTYRFMGSSTDGGYLMEKVWNDILQPGGYSRVRLYEKQSPYGDFPPSTSSFPVDAPLSRNDLIDQWSSQDYGLIKVAGHGDALGVYRRYWNQEYVADQVVQNPTRPLSGFGNQSQWELTDLIYLSFNDRLQLQTPGAKSPVLIAMSCSTGNWSDPANLPNKLMTTRRISAWIGGSSTLDFDVGWEKPSDGGGQTIDYRITDALMRRELPIGEAVWTSLAGYFTWANGSQWNHTNWSWGFLNWDLYGDPSMGYWGNGPDLGGSWPMFHYDWPGRGETALVGPQGLLIKAAWSRAIAATVPGLSSPSPVIGHDGRLLIGDSSGDLHAFAANGTELWSYHTGGPIVNAPALSADGTAYVKSQDGLLYAITRDGALRWSRVVRAGEASPKIARDGTIYVGGSDYGGPGGSVRYFLAAYRPNGTRAAVRLVDGRVTTAPSFGRDDTVWVGTAAGTLYRMPRDLSTSTAYALTPGSALGSGLALADDTDKTVLVPSSNGSLIAWSATNETVRWTFSASDAIHAAPALGANGQVFVGSRDGKVYALRLSNGSKLWEYDTGGAVDSSPALDPLYVYVVGGDPATLYALQRWSGNVHWSGEIGGTSQGGSSPAIGHSRLLYVASSEGYVIVVGNSSWMPPPVLTTDPRPDRIALFLSLPDPDARVQVERREPGGNWGVQSILDPGINQYDDFSIAAGQAYEYRAMAVPAVVGIAQATEPSDYSAIVSVRSLPAVPSTPTAPTVTPLSATELRLTWTPAASNVVSLDILRRGPTQTGFETVTVVPAGVTEFTDGGLEPNSLYAYRLRASNESGDSAPGDVGSTSTLPRTLPAPVQVVVHALDDNTFTVCWTPAAGDLNAVVARRPLGLAQLEILGTVLAGQTCHVDDTAYRHAFEYWVKHVNAAGSAESAWTRSALTWASGYDPGFYHIYLPLVLKGFGP